MAKNEKPPTPQEWLESSEGQEFAEQLKRDEQGSRERQANDIEGSEGRKEEDKRKSRKRVEKDEASSRERTEREDRESRRRVREDDAKYGRAVPEEAEPEESNKEKFLAFVEQEITALEQDGTIFPEEAAERRRAAVLVGEQQIENPEEDAFELSRMSMPRLREMAALLTKEYPRPERGHALPGMKPALESPKDEESAKDEEGATSPEAVESEPDSEVERLARELVEARQKKNRKEKGFQAELKRVANEIDDLGNDVRRQIVDRAKQLEEEPESAETGAESAEDIREKFPMEDLEGTRKEKERDRMDRAFESMRSRFYDESKFRIAEEKLEMAERILEGRQYDIFAQQGKEYLVANKGVFPELQMLGEGQIRELPKERVMNLLYENEAFKTQLGEHAEWKKAQHLRDSFNLSREHDRDLPSHVKLVAYKELLQSGAPPELLREFWEKIEGVNLQDRIQEKVGSQKAYVDEHRFVRQRELVQEKLASILPKDPKKREAMQTRFEIKASHLRELLGVDVDKATVALLADKGFRIDGIKTKPGGFLWLRKKVEFPRENGTKEKKTMEQAKKYVLWHKEMLETEARNRARFQLKEEWEANMAAEEQRLLQELGAQVPEEVIEQSYTRLQEDLAKDFERRFVKGEIDDSEKGQEIFEHLRKNKIDAADLIADAKDFQERASFDFEEDEELLYNMAAKYGFGDRKLWEASRAEIAQKMKEQKEKGGMGVFGFLLSAVFESLVAKEKPAAAQNA
ncbi:MAG TPA: hypothetical protein VFE94_00970 [Candidatus Paceibacterota bacterium]|nr:hypothetical protein [Candidatus Paceibacterota bacterium]